MFPLGKRTVGFFALAVLGALVLPLSLQAGWLESGLAPRDLRSESVFGGEAGSRVQVYFGLPPYANPGGIGLREGLEQAFDSATQSIRAAFFQINDPTFVQSLIRAVERGVTVELTTDRCYRTKKGYKEELDRLAKAMDQAGQPSATHLVDDGTESCDQAFNHNKYAVIDYEKGEQARTWVGSYNVTAHGAPENFDIALLVEGAALAQVLKLDHEQMMAGAYQVAKKTVLRSSKGLEVLSDAEISQARAQARELEYPSVTVGSGDQVVKIQVLVSPKSKSLRRIIESVYSAKKEVLFSTFAIGDAMLVSALINKFGEGVGDNRLPVLVRAEPWEKPALQARKGNAVVPVGDASSIVRDLFTSLGDEADNYTIGTDPKTAKLKTTFNFVYPAGAAGGAVQKVKMLGIFGNKNVGGSTPWDRLVAAGVPMLRNTANGELHNKLFLIDGETIILGSHNFSQSADNGNDEVTLIIKSAAIGKFIRDHYLMPTRFFTTPNERVLSSVHEKPFHDYRKAQVLISEVHAPDYVELYNSGSTPINLLGFRISTAFFPLTAGEKVRKAEAGGTENEIVGYLPPQGSESVGQPLYDPATTLLKPGQFALVVGRDFQPEAAFARFRAQFQKVQGREPEVSELPLLLTTGGFFSRGVGGAQGIRAFSRITLYGIDGFSVIDRCEYPVDSLDEKLESGVSVERVSLVAPRRAEASRQIREMPYTVVTGRPGGAQSEEKASFTYYGFPSPYQWPQDWRLGSEKGGTPGYHASGGTSSRGPATLAEKAYGIEGTVVDVETGGVQKSLVVIENGLIAGVHASGSAAAQAAKSKLTQVISGKYLIYPGLIDTHNHIKYNYLPIWKTPQDKYNNRNEWPDESVYTGGIKKIYAEVYKEHPVCKGALECEAQARCTAIRYAEIKALAGGTTSIQGSTSFSDETEDFTFRGLTSRKPESQAAKPEALLSACLVGGARNIERESFGLADQSRSTAKGIDDDLWGFKHLGLPRWPQTAAAKLRKEMDEGATTSFFVHIGEGIDAQSSAEYERLEALGLATPQTTVIHGTALDQAQFTRMAKAGVNLSWSPFSNLLLYGRTTDIPAALKAGVNVSLASDWSLSGSKSLLGELKVADQVNRQMFNGSLTDLDLVQMVTVNPAQAWGMSSRVGKVSEGLAADILVIRDRGSRDGALRALIEAQEEDVMLVTVGGRALYGDSAVVSAASADRKPEVLADGVCGRSSKAFALDYTSGARSLAEISKVLSGELSRGASALPEKVKGSLGADFLRLDPVCESGDARYQQVFESLSSGRLVR